MLEKVNKYAERNVSGGDWGGGRDRGRGVGEGEIVL